MKDLRQIAAITCIRVIIAFGYAGFGSGAGKYAASDRNRAIADPRREEKNKKPTFIERIPDNVQINASKYWK